MVNMPFAYTRYMSINLPPVTFTKEQMEREKTERGGTCGRTYSETDEVYLRGMRYTDDIAKAMIQDVSFH